MFGLSIVGIVFLVVVLPIWIIAHYATRWRTTKTLSSGEEQLLTELWESAEKMDGRHSRH